MKVLFHLLDAGIGGGQLVASRVAAALVDHGHEIGLVVPATGPAADRFRNLGAQIVIIDAETLRHPLAARSLAQTLRDYDVLYSHTSTPGAILGAAAAKLAHRPQVVHQHTFPYFSPSAPARLIQQLLLRRVAGSATFIAVAEHVRSGLVAAGIQSTQIAVVPNGVPPAQAVVPATAATVVRVGMLARLDPGKNIHVFLEAAARAKPTTAARYVVGGASGPFSAHERGLREQAARAGIEIVQAQDGEAFLRELDVVVIPSSYEGSPLVLFEAMALGRAVIASDIPGMREALAPEEAGILVPPADVAALTVAIEQLVDDETKRAKLGRRARDVVTSRYRLTTMLEQTAEILDQAVLVRR